MSSGASDTINLALRQWLRTDQLLGIRHWPVALPAPRDAGPPQKATPTSRNAGSKPLTPPEEDTGYKPAPRARDAAARSADASPRSAHLPSALPVVPARTDLPDLCNEELSREAATAALEALNAQYVRGCTACGLHETRTQTVFGVGHPRAELMFVGEGPGADEDRQGEPFVGKAGQLLTKMIAAMTLTREQVYIANIVKCRPPGNRTPLTDEMDMCSPYLLRQIAIIRPRLIIALGRPATQTLLATAAPISKVRGQIFDFPPPQLAITGLPQAQLLPTFHPAYLLRSPDEKGKAWADLQEAMRFLGLTRPVG